jgi:hypothetical protein
MNKVFLKFISILFLMNKKAFWAYLSVTPMLLKVKIIYKRLKVYGYVNTKKPQTVYIDYKKVYKEGGFVRVLEVVSHEMIHLLQMKKYGLKDQNIAYYYNNVIAIKSTRNYCNNIFEMEAFSTEIDMLNESFNMSHALVEHEMRSLKKDRDTYVLQMQKYIQKISKRKKTKK